MTRFFSYLLECSDGSIYCGFTTDPARRLAEHNGEGGAKYTRSRRPVKLAALWLWRDKNEAMSAEWHIKRLPREKKIALVEHPRTIARLLALPLSPQRFFSKRTIEKINSSYFNKI